MNRLEGLVRKGLVIAEVAGALAASRGADASDVKTEAARNFRTRTVTGQEFPTPPKPESNVSQTGETAESKEQTSFWGGYVNVTELGGGWNGGEAAEDIYYDTTGRRMEDDEIADLASRYYIVPKSLDKGVVMADGQVLDPGVDYEFYLQTMPPVVTAESQIGEDGDKLAQNIEPNEPKKEPPRQGDKPKPEDPIATVADIRSFYEIEEEPQLIPRDDLVQGMNDRGYMEATVGYVFEVHMDALDAKLGGGTLIKVIVSGELQNKFYSLKDGQITPLGTFEDLNELVNSVEVAVEPAATWDATSGEAFPDEDLSQSIKERMAANPKWVWKVPGIPTILDLTNAPEWLAFTFTGNNASSLVITPIASVQESIWTQMMPVVVEGIRLDDGSVAAIDIKTNKEVVFNVSSGELRQSVVEFRDLSQYGKDMAAYALDFDESKVSWTVVNNGMKLVRTVDETGTIVVRCYVAEGMSNGSESMATMLVQAQVFADSDQPYNLVSPAMLKKESIPARKFVITSKSGKTYELYIGVFMINRMYWGSDIKQYFDLPYDEDDFTLEEPVATKIPAAQSGKYVSVFDSRQNAREQFRQPQRAPKKLGI